ncbi:MAG: ATP-grasp domain-containing protein [Acetobacteraceae bacterium]|nr:ATP-grasp domain-containing protein [Acetobacteraceae bacterium]
MATILLTLGRLPKALDLARGFALAGHRVVVAEPFGRHLAGASRHVARRITVPPPVNGAGPYLDALAEAARREGADLVVPVSEEVLHVAALRPRLPPATRLLAMPPALILAVHHKGAFVEAASAMGLPVPDTAALGSEAAAALAEAGDVVVKPAHSCAGQGVRVIRRGEALPRETSAHIVQRFLPGAEFSTCSLAREGEVLGTTVYRGIRFSGSVAIAFERVDHPAIEAWVTRFARETRWSGFLSFDFREDARGLAHAIECNPRTTSGLHFFRAEDIAPAILDGRKLRHRDERELQQFYSMLTEAQNGMFRRGFFARLRECGARPDVTWNRADPLPFLTMTWTAWPIIRAAMRHRATFGEVAMRDLAWNGAAPEAGSPEAPGNLERQHHLDRGVREAI